MKDEQVEYQAHEKFPRCTGLLLMRGLILSLYENRSIFIWEMEGSTLNAIRSIITHHAAITQVSLLDEYEDALLFFSSTSLDGTIRLWHFYEQGDGRTSLELASQMNIKPNGYCSYLTRIIYTRQLERQVIATAMMLKQYLVAITHEELLVFSLDNYELLTAETCS